MTTTIGIICLGTSENGGVYQYTQSLVEALIIDPHYNYIIFTRPGDNRFNKYKCNIREIQKSKSSLITKSTRCIQLLLGIRYPLFFSKNEMEAYNDIDLFISPAAKPYPHFYLNKPFIFTLHDLQERYFPKFFNIRQRFTRWLCNRALASHAKKILCESHFVKNDIIKFIGVNENKIHILPSPPPLTFSNFNFEEDKFQHIQQKYKLPEGYIFYPAQSWIHKNHIKLLEALKIIHKSQKITLVLTGTKNKYYEKIENKIRALNLVHYVKHLGYVDDEELPYLYKMSTMLVMPTLFESISQPIYEAFSLEVPVCSSQVVGLPEQIGDAGLLFNPYDSKDIADKILMYLNDSNLRISNAKLGKKVMLQLDQKKYKNHILAVSEEIFRFQTSNRMEFLHDR